jgi:hypothetical protein
MLKIFEYDKNYVLVTMKKSHDTKTSAFFKNYALITAKESRNAYN